MNNINTINSHHSAAQFLVRLLEHFDHGEIITIVLQGRGYYLNQSGDCNWSIKILENGFEEFYQAGMSSDMGFTSIDSSDLIKAVYHHRAGVNNFIKNENWELKI